MEGVDSHKGLQKACSRIRGGLLKGVICPSKQHSGAEAKGNIYLKPPFMAEIYIPSGEPWSRIQQTALRKGRRRCYMAKQELGLFHAKVSHQDVDQLLWRKNVGLVHFKEEDHNMAERIQLVGGFEEIARNLLRDETGRRCILPLVRPEDVETPCDKVMPSIMCWTFRYEDFPQPELPILAMTQLQRAIDLGNLEENFILMSAIAEEVIRLIKLEVISTKLCIMSPFAYEVR